MTEFIENLRRFNSKERFYLVGWALGRKDFEIHTAFRQTLSRLFGGLEIPEAPFAAMDYHLDWIYASALLASPDAQNCRTIRGVDIREKKPELCITTTQEDIDFVIAFPDSTQPTRSHLIMIEAKGDSPFTNRQLQSKGKRLSAIFGDNGGRWRDIVVPHFAITSPRAPTERLKKDGLPKFMLGRGTLLWFPLQQWPEHLLKITRCDVSGTDDSGGAYWKVERR